MKIESMDPEEKEIETKLSYESNSAKVGDEITFNMNPHGIVPRMNTAKILEVKESMITLANPVSSTIYKVKCKFGHTYWVKDEAIEEIKS